MATTGIQVFKNEDGTCPFLDWFFWLQDRNRRAFAACIARIRLLREHGHELDRPHSGYLGRQVHELRWNIGHVNYRVLYFFHGLDVVVLSHGITKEGKVPKAEIDAASRRLEKVEGDELTHLLTYEEMCRALSERRNNGK